MRNRLLAVARANCLGGAAAAAASRAVAPGVISPRSLARWLDRKKTRRWRLRGGVHIKFTSSAQAFRSDADRSTSWCILKSEQTAPHDLNE